MRLRLPRQLFEQANLLVKNQQVGSVNDFIVDAVTAYVSHIEREAIDAALAGMAEDRQYRREVLQILREFGG